MNSVYKAVAIGASAGGVKVLAEIIANLPQGILTPIFIVQHQMMNADETLLAIINNVSQLPCIYALSGERIKSGTIYFAPPGYHLLVENQTQLALSDDTPVNYSMPSIDVLFESAADVYREQLLGIVLTGANSDGAQGLNKIESYGGMAMVQSPDSAECDLMPKAAIAQTAGAKVASPAEIAANIKEYCYG